MRRTLALAGAVLVALVAPGCSGQPSDDRSGEAGGRDADTFADATDVTVVRNIDDVPNVALFCADGIRFAATLSGDGTRPPQLVELSPDFQTCAR